MFNWQCSTEREWKYFSYLLLCLVTHLPLRWIGSQYDEGDLTYSTSFGVHLRLITWARLHSTFDAFGTSIEVLKLSQDIPRYHRIHSFDMAYCSPSFPPNEALSLMVSVYSFARLQLVLALRKPSASFRDTIHDNKANEEWTFCTCDHEFRTRLTSMSILLTLFSVDVLRLHRI